jgi:threonine dehydrogenase-like Zn-dependent dehydrogenase
LGIIEQVGERAAARWGVKPGDRVAPESYIPCRHCAYCFSGNYTSCQGAGRRSHGYTPLEVGPGVWGAYANYMYLHPNTIVHKISNDLPADIAAMYNPLGAGVRWAAHMPQTQLGDTVVILGPGQRGLSCVIGARSVGAGTIIITGLSRDRTKLQLARELGADYTINVEEDNAVERVRDITRGAGADVVVDVSAFATQPILDAVDMVRQGGTIILAGLKGDQARTNLTTDLIVRKALTVKGAYGVDAAAYRQAIRIIESGRYPLEKLHTHTFPLKDVVEAIETLAGHVPGQQDAVHVTLDPSA